MRRRSVPTELGVVRSRLGVRDLVREGLLSISRSRGRSMATAIGTILGTAAFVATLGLSSTLQRQVSSSFDIRRSTEVIVQPDAKGIDTGWQAAAALAGLRRLNGVAHAGARLTLPPHTVSRALGVAGVQTPIVGADPDAVAVMAPRMVAGRRYDQFHESRAVPVVLLPSSLARQLSVARVGVAVFIDDQAYVVIGIFDDVARRPEALLSVVMPLRVAQGIGVRPGAPEPDRDVVIETAPGAAQLIGGQAPLALRPEGPDALRAVAPPDPRTLRREVEASVTRTSLVLSVIALLIGTIAIGNSAMAAVAARTAEIGLRRAVGGRPRHIFAQLVMETTVLGGLGGCVGALLGAVITTAVSLWQRWQPVLDLRVASAAVVAGAVAGLAAGLWPAARAMRTQPVDALQR